MTARCDGSGNLTESQSSIVNYPSSASADQGEALMRPDPSFFSPMTQSCEWSLWVTVLDISRPGPILMRLGRAASV